MNDLEPLDRGCDQPLLEIPIKGFMTKHLARFWKDRFDYDGQTMQYAEIQSVSYYSVKHSINFAPTVQVFTFAGRSVTRTISFDFEVNRIFPKARLKNAFNEIVRISKTLIEPAIVRRLANEVLNGGSLYFGDVSLTNNGYSIQKFMGGIAEVKWSEKIYLPSYLTGDVVFWKDKNGKGTEFGRVPMSNPNAILIPELVQEIVHHVRA